MTFSGIGLLRRCMFGSRLRIQASFSATIRASPWKNVFQNKSVSIFSFKQKMSCRGYPLLFCKNLNLTAIWHNQYTNNSLLKRQSDNLAIAYIMCSKSYHVLHSLSDVIFHNQRIFTYLCPFLGFHLLVTPPPTSPPSPCHTSLFCKLTPAVSLTRSESERKENSMVKHMSIYAKCLFVT